jgi:hypothetical protein
MRWPIAASKSGTPVRRVPFALRFSNNGNSSGGYIAAVSAPAMSGRSMMTSLTDG